MQDRLRKYEIELLPEDIFLGSLYSTKTCKRWRNQLSAMWSQTFSCWKQSHNYLVCGICWKKDKQTAQEQVKKHGGRTSWAGFKGTEWEMSWDTCSNGLNGATWDWRGKEMEFVELQRGGGEIKMIGFSWWWGKEKEHKEARVWWSMPWEDSFSGENTLRWRSLTPNGESCEVHGGGREKKEQLQKVTEREAWPTDCG